MAYKTRYIPENASKYIGNPINIICRSLWERKVCKWMDFNENEIETLIIEVKPKKQTMKPAKKRATNKNFIRESITFEINNSKWKAAESFCKNKGWKFVILTEEHLFPKSK